MDTAGRRLPYRYALMAAKAYAFDILRPLQAAIRRAGGEAAWILHDLDPKHLRPDETLLPDVPAMQRFAPRAVFSAANWVPHMIPGVKVQVFHGFNVNKHGGDHFRLRGEFDLYCTQGPDTTETFKQLEALHGHFRVAETGWPKLDPLFDPNIQTLPVTRDRPIVLYASTFSPSMTSAPHLLETVRRLSATGRWRWLVTLHPKMDAELVRAWRALEGEFLTYVPTERVIPYLKAGDAMVCDTSSIVSEFTMQQRPAVVFRSQMTGDHLLRISEPEDLERAVETALAPPPELTAALRQYAGRIHPHHDGRSGERVLQATERFLTENASAHLARKPLNLWRRFQTRQRLNWWRP